jgi:signal-transduction protein with cAMP-binding, CBS, and nucleotidyltransferase domain
LPLLTSVKEIANKKILSIEEAESVKSAAQSMLKNDVSSLMVTSNGKPVGIVTERDVLRRVTVKGIDPVKTSVKGIMSSPLITIKSDASLADATILMHLKKVRHLFVMDGGKVVCIFTDRDLLLQVFELFTTLGQL